MSLSVFDLVREHHLHVIFSSFLCALILKRTLTTHKRNSNGLPLPPGPKGFPIIGNLPDMPTDKQWLVYNQRWSEYQLRADRCSVGGSWCCHTLISVPRATGFHAYLRLLLAYSTNQGNTFPRGRKPTADFATMKVSYI